MTQAKCIKIIKDTKGNITKFVLADSNNNTKEVTPIKLKQAIKAGKINVVNLQLKQDKNSLLEKEKLKVYIRNAKAFGYKVEEIKTKCDHLCYLVSKSDIEHILYIPDDVTSCYNLLSSSPIQGKLKVIGASNVTDMQSMFKAYLYIVFLDFSNFDISKVTSMDYMFNGCSNLESLDLSNFNTSNVKNMYNMFEGCLSLQSLDISSFNTSKVTSMNSMFDRCSNLQSLDLSNFDTSKVPDMDYMFNDCGSIQSLDISNFDTSKVTSMYKIFAYCNAKIKTKDARIIKAYPNLCV